MADRQLVHRGRVLQQHEQSAARPAVRVELLVEFCRALIRIHPNSDALYLSLLQAKDAAQATDEELELFARAVLDEQRQSPWPEGFFG
jgi:hypothetical protein